MSVPTTTAEVASGSSPTSDPSLVTGRRPLRLALLLDDLVQPVWIKRAIELSLTEGNAVIGVVVLNSGADAATRRTSRWRSWIRNRQTLLYALYGRLDARKFPVHVDPFVPADLTTLVGDAPVLRVSPRRTKFSDYLEDVDVERIASCNIDVALRFGFRILRGRALGIARHGVWSYHHGDHTVNRGGPAGFWEVMEGDGVTGAMLQRLSEELDAGVVLAQGWTRTDRFSVGRNRARYYWNAVPFVARALRALASGVVPAARAEPLAYSDRLYAVPRNGKMAGSLARLTGRYVASHLRALLQTEQWLLAYRQTRRDASDHDVIPDLAPYRFRTLTPPADRFWADPFPVRHDGRDWIIFEELVYRNHIAHLSAIEIGPDGPVGAPFPVLTRDYHLSYPFVLEHRGSHFLIPETAETGRVEVWRASRFPGEWTLEQVAMEGRPLVDATLAEIDGIWWMFAGANEAGLDSADDLYLFHAKSPLGPWTPHAANPVLSDVRSGRPAGRLFQSGGAWYRPAQDGSHGYGSAITINRIVTLNTREYREVPVTRLEPRWRPDLVGVHTVNAIAGLTVIDARRRRWRFGS